MIDFISISEKQPPMSEESLFMNENSGSISTGKRTPFGYYATSCGMMVYYDDGEPIRLNPTHYACISML